MLMAANLPLPKHIVGHGWLTKDGEALSKTRGIFIDMDGDIATYGVDPFRYYLLREFSFGNDGDYRPALACTHATTQTSPTISATYSIVSSV